MTYMFVALLAVWTRSVAPNPNFDATMTDMMEKLPTELMQEVVGYLDKPTIRSFTIVSSKYCEIAQPLIFRRISINEMADERFALFVEQMENSIKLASMIKILIICRSFTTELLRHLFATVFNLEELFIQFIGANFLLSPHYFPNLRRLHFPVFKPKLFNDLATNFIPYHEFLNVLNIPFFPDSFSDPSTLSMLPLPESASSSVNHLVTYHGPRDLLLLLTLDSRMKHLTSSQQLDEGALHKLSHVVSRRLRSLIIDDPMDVTTTKTLPALLIPSLFPNLRSIAWLSVDPTSSSCIDQLPHLRRVWLRSTHSRQLPESIQAFITKIQDLSDKKNRPLREIRLYAPGGRPFSHTYSKPSIQGKWVLQTALPVKPFVSQRILRSDRMFMYPRRCGASNTDYKLVR